METVLLHHYPGSPFAEKVRLFMGYKSLSWGSVYIPAIMPKPDLVALTGGYRKTPVLQIGADVYCDTSLIVRLIDASAPAEAKTVGIGGSAAKIIAQWADSTLFWAAVTYATQPSGMANLFPGATASDFEAFAADRRTFRASVPRLRLPDAAAALQIAIGDLDGLISGDAFFFGTAASLADFSVYHCLWFVHRAGLMTPFFADHPKLHGWFERMTALGHGQPVKVTSEEAIAIATRSQPTAVDRKVTTAGSANAGDRVTVRATDYGTDPVEGTLLRCCDTEIVIHRDDPRCGELHVHFPRTGFSVAPLA